MTASAPWGNVSSHWATYASERLAVLSSSLLVTVCVGAVAAVICCAVVCVTLGVIANSALRGSRSTDRPQIIRALATAFRHFLRPWWRRQ
ncbi:hypothetical protein ACWC5C_31030 [Streptomyces sp. NPDC001700]